MSKKWEAVQIGAALCLPEDVEPNDAEVPGAAPAAASTAPASSETAAEPEAEPNTLIVTFRTTHAALAFERACRQAKAPGRLSPIPNQVSAGCGYAWRADLVDRDAVLAAAQAAGCEYDALHELAL